MATSELNLRVTSMTWESEGVLSLRLASPRGGELPAWEAGAHIDLVLREGLVRQYSLCGPREDREHYEISVLRETESRGGSRYIHEALRPGDVLPVHGPRNHFPLEDAPGFLFIAGGIGVTPILAMIDEAERRRTPWRLLYGGRTRASMAFLDRLAAHGDKVTVAPQDESGLLDLDGALRTLPEIGEGARVYACGPEPLLAALEARCAPLGEDVLHIERFSAPEVDKREHVPPEAIRVELAQTGTTLDVGPDESILERVLAAGVDVANDCRDGICGSCEVGVLEGTPDHRDFVLTEREQRKGDKMMICVSRCLGDRLVLDL